MISGMRKEPPISTISPREIITSCSGAKVFNTSRVAAALLLTTTAAFEPVIFSSKRSTWASRCMRPPVVMST